MPHIPQPVETENGYQIQCPICRTDLQIDNQNATSADRSRGDAMIHLLCHMAWMTEETVFPGDSITPGT